MYWYRWHVTNFRVQLGSGSGYATDHNAALACVAAGIAGAMESAPLSAIDHGQDGRLQIDYRVTPQS